MPIVDPIEVYDKVLGGFRSARRASLAQSFIVRIMSSSTTADIEQTHQKSADVVVRGKASGFLQEVVSGKHRFRADEPASIGGSDAAPTPYDYVLAGLGACTSMTVALYARRKKWPLEDVVVSLRHSRIHARDCEECDTKEGMLDLRAARKAQGDRRQMPGSSHARIRDQHQARSFSAGGGELSDDRARTSKLPCFLSGAF